MPSWGTWEGNDLDNEASSCNALGFYGFYGFLECQALGPGGRHRGRRRADGSALEPEPRPLLRPSRWNAGRKRVPPETDRGAGLQSPVLDWAQLKLQQGAAEFDWLKIARALCFSSVSLTVNIKSIWSEHPTEYGLRDTWGTRSSYFFRKRRSSWRRWWPLRSGRQPPRKWASSIASLWTRTAKSISTTTKSGRRGISKCSSSAWRLWSPDGAGNCPDGSSGFDF